MKPKKSNHDRIGDVLSSLIDELEERGDLSEVPVKDLLSSIMTAAKLLVAVQDESKASDPIQEAIKALKK
jgi:polyhydroxyalkanoate synthesis regulator phasin